MKKKKEQKKHRCPQELPGLEGVLLVGDRSDRRVQASEFGCREDPCRIVSFSRKVESV